MSEHDTEMHDTGMHDNEIDVAVEDERWEGVAPDLEGFVARAVEAALAIVPPDGPIEISIVLTDDPAVQELNRTWRGKDKPTNVLSFPNEQPHGGGPRLLGDVVLAYDTMLRESGSSPSPSITTSPISWFMARCTSSVTTTNSATPRPTPWRRWKSRPCGASACRTRMATWPVEPRTPSPQTRET